MRALLLACVACVVFRSVPASAVTFDFTTASGATLNASQAAAYAAAAQAWSSVLTDNVVINLSIGFSSTLAANVLASTNPSLATLSYGGYSTLLAADSKTAVDRSVVAANASLAAPSSSILVSTAEARALGAAVGASSDGTILFNSSFNFQTSRNADGTVASSAYDMIGIAEHEIGHLLGFVSSLDISQNARSGLDLERFSSSGVRGFAVGAAAYFSIDGGVTAIEPFSTGSGDQASHWANNSTYNGQVPVMDPEGIPGQVINVTALDVMALDAIGWDGVYDTASADVPEPLALAVIALGFLLLGVGMVRRTGSFPSRFA